MLEWQRQQALLAQAKQANGGGKRRDYMRQSGGSFVNRPKTDTTGFLESSVNLAKRVGKSTATRVVNAASDLADTTIDYAKAIDAGGGMQLRYNERAAGERLRDKAEFAFMDGASTLLEMGLLGR